MRMVTCSECHTTYDYDKEDLCPKCGTFNRPGKKGPVRRVDGLNEANHAGSFAHDEFHAESRERLELGLDRKKKVGDRPLMASETAIRKKPKKKKKETKEENEALWMIGGLFAIFCILMGIGSLPGWLEEWSERSAERPKQEQAASSEEEAEEETDLDEVPVVLGEKFLMRGGSVSFEKIEKEGSTLQVYVSGTLLPEEDPLLVAVDEEAAAQGAEDCYYWFEPLAPELTDDARWRYDFEDVPDSLYLILCVYDFNTDRVYTNAVGYLSEQG